MRYDILLFDADNTLFDFTACEAKALAATLDECGIRHLPGMTEVYSKYNDDCWKALERGEITKKELVVKRYALFLQHYGLENNPEKVNAAYEENLSNTVIFIDGALEMIKRLYGKARIYIITNGLTKVQTGRFAKTELKKYIEKLFISEQMGCKKPDALFFEQVAEEIEGFSRNRAVVIGDSLTSDIKGANNSDLDCVWYNPAGIKAPENLRITKIVGNFSELEAFLSGN